MSSLGKRRYGFLTDWQRKYILGQVELKPSKKLTVRQRKKIEDYHVEKSFRVALDDMELIRYWYEQKQSEMSKSVLFMLNEFRSWAMRKREKIVTLTTMCPYCGGKFHEDFRYDKKKLKRAIRTTFFGRSVSVRAVEV